MTIRRIPVVSALIMALIFAFAITPFLVEPVRNPNIVRIDNFREDVEVISADSYCGFEGDLFMNTTFLITYIIGLLIISSVFLFLLNNRDIRRYINTSIRLAGFNNNINLITKKTYINEEVFMEIIRAKLIRVKFLLPLFENYEDYGFVQIENHVFTTSELENLPLKLRVIKSYLKSNQ